MPAETTGQDSRYLDAVRTYGDAVIRLAGGYEANAERRNDLLQEIHIALWKSFAGFDGQCSLRTWVYRVAHNTAATFILRERRARIGQWVSLDHIDNLTDDSDVEAAVHNRRVQDRLYALILRLEPSDRQIILLYLDDMDAASIGEITGFKPNHIATKIHRLKAALSEAFQETCHDK